jgi:uncharacterized protein (TIGR04255 family)
MKRERLTKAPIQEAIFDVTFGEEIQPSQYEIFGEHILEHFPIKKELVKAELKIPDSNQQNPEIKRDKFAINYSNEKLNQMVQTRTNGFTFFQLNKTYTEWDDFRNEATKWLNKYIGCIKVKTSKRIALRFINQFEIPSPTKDLKEYIEILPDLGSDLKRHLNNIMMRLEIPNDHGATGIFTEIINPSIEDKLNVYIDIDVFIEKTNDEHYQLNADKYLSDFELLRDFKNEIFFSSLTEESKKIFN